VQLIKVDDGFQLWGETYDRTLNDIFALQDDIAQCVVKALREQLLGETTSASTIARELSAITARRTENPEAQRLILQAKFFSAKRQPEDLRRATLLCEQAIGVDPDYAEAYAVAAMVQGHIAFYGDVSMTSVSGEVVQRHLTKAEALAAHALMLDPTQAQALLTASDVSWHTQRDLKRRLRELEAALKQAPDDTSLLRIYAHTQQHAGEQALAEEVAARTLVLDPLSVAAHVTYAGVALFRGEVDAAEQRIRHALELDTSSWWLRWHLFRILLTRRDLEGAARARIASAANRGQMVAAKALERAYEQGGWDGFVRAIVEDPSIVYLRLEVTYAHIELGNFTEALDWIEADLDNFGQGPEDIQHDRLLDPLRNDPRFAGLVKRAGF
jgi:tetratricopeptide (TPR) repeat protein